MFYSPLRYPGGKSKLAPFIKELIRFNNLEGCTYIEPFAGGAGVALDLLFDGVVSKIVINDYDKGIYSFWFSILTQTDRFIGEIEKATLTIEEWRHQKDIYLNNNAQCSFELGFATFYLNRTNHSGIITAAVIGGQKQESKYKINSRFNKEVLINRIKRIAERKEQIHVYCEDIESFIHNHIANCYKAFVYFDPPYFEQGKGLYPNFFKYQDHTRVEKVIREKVICPWVMTYDIAPEIVDIYKNYPLRVFDLKYSVNTKRKARELMIFKYHSMIPNSESNNINLRKII